MADTDMNAQLIEHMMEPKNYGILEDFNSQGVGKNPDNGEKVVISLKITESNGEPVIGDIRFQAIGCMTTVVAGSIITEEAKGLGIARAYELVDTTMRILGGVPPQDAACTEMVALALQAALDTHEARKEDPDYPAITYQITQSCTPKEEGI